LRRRANHGLCTERGACDGLPNAFLPAKQRDGPFSGIAGPSQYAHAGRKRLSYRCVGSKSNAKTARLCRLSARANQHDAQRCCAWQQRGGEGVFQIDAEEEHSHNGEHQKGDDLKYHDYDLPLIEPDAAHRPGA